MLAQAFHGDGQKQEALRAVNQVLAREPDNDAAKRLKIEIEK